MKKYKFILIILFLLAGITVNAQEVEHDGTTYLIKGKEIFKDGEVVTNNLDDDLRKEIFAKHEAKIRDEKKIREREKELKRAERKAEKAEKELKRAERELERRQKLRKRFDRASEKLEDAQKKYERLRRKGKLSPNEEEDWLEKIEKLQEDVNKHRKRLRKS